MYSHTPADENWEQYQKDIEREKGSFLALYSEHYNNNVIALINHMAESLAYQYSVNRMNNKLIKDLIPERKNNKTYNRDEVFELLKELRRECIESHNKGLSPENIGIAQYIN